MARAPTERPPVVPLVQRSLDRIRRGETNHRVEFLAGLTTFVTMAYIIFVNPAIMSASGLDKTALTIGTIIAAFLPTLVLGLWADLPWALAPGMGYNAFFAFTVVLTYKVPVGAALALVFLDGLAFLLLVAGPWRERIFMGIPQNLKLAAGAGIGLFIALIGMANAGIVKFDAFRDIKEGPNLIGNGGVGIPTLGSLGDPAVMVALIGLIITGWLLAHRVRRSLLLGILATTAIVWIAGGLNSSWQGPLQARYPKGLNDFIGLPDFGTFVSKGLLKLDFGALVTLAAGAGIGLVILAFVTFLVTDMMDSFGTFSGLASKLNILDRRGNFPGSGKAMMVDAGAGMWGPVVGTATIATYIESAAGVGEGGKSGLTAVWVSLFFLAALLFVPLVGLVPPVATAPVLIIVGFLMVEPILRVNFSDVTEGLPAFLALIMMPLTFSIAEGMFAGIVSYVVLKSLTGRIHEVSWTMWGFGALLMLGHILQAAIHAS